MYVVLIYSVLNVFNVEICFYELLVRNDSLFSCGGENKFIQIQK